MHHLGVTRTLFAFPSPKITNAFSQRNTCRTSALFQAGQILNPYSPHYRMTFASSDILFSHPQQCALRFTCSVPKPERKYEVSTFHVIDSMDDLGAPYYAGGTTVPCRQLKDLQPDHLPLTRGSSLRPVKALVNPRRSVAYYDA